MGHKHHHQHAPRQVEETVVSMVYVTQKPTFDGPIAGYTTLGPKVQNSPKNVSPQKPAPLLGVPIQQDADEDEDEDESPPKSPVVQSPRKQSTFTNTFQTKTTPTSRSVSASETETESRSLQSSSSPQPTSLLTATSPISVPGLDQSTSASEASATAQPTEEASPQGMSGGAKAGLALGIIAIVVGLSALFFLLYRRKLKKGEQYTKTNDEKSHFSHDGSVFATARAPSTRTARTASTAPRLSLRPVTEFSPNLGADGKAAGAHEPVKSAFLTPAAAAGPTGYRQKPTPAIPPQQSLPETNSAQAQAGHPANPFGNHAERSNEGTSATRSEPEAVSPLAAPQTSTAAPIGAESVNVDTAPSGTASAASPESSLPVAGVTAAAAGAGLGMAAAAGHRQNAPQPLKISKTPSPDAAGSRSPASIDYGQPSPAGTEFSGSSVPGSPAASMLAAGGPGASCVHRVQLDFKPSMDDELGLRAGQLVRLLHEYDDGWALCIRLDRSQQGVAPRTCLSTRPVKPRPAGPPQGHPGRGPPPNMRLPIQGPSAGPHMRLPIQGRPGPPRGGPPRAMSPAGGRQSPRPYANQPRSMSPGPGRASPGPHGRQPTAPYANGQRPRSPSMGGRGSPGPYGPQYARPMSPANGNRSRSNSAMSAMSGMSGAPRSRSNSAAASMNRSPPGRSAMNPHHGSPPQGQRHPTVLRSGSPARDMNVAPQHPIPDAPPQQSGPMPSRKPVPGQAL
ncbi:MAG: hypothetical protein M1833_000497 [Piccolia ochrophora]|nr:MAG: hypothetical protein M1833_000497 [Piccolia ochrophora]